VANLVKQSLTAPGSPRQERRLQSAHRLVDHGVPFLYSPVHASAKMLRERPDVVQRVVAAFAETIHFVEKNPEKAKAAVAKAMRTNDAVALQASYDGYAKEIVDRRMIFPEKAVAETIEQTRLAGGTVRRKPEELYDNGFTAS
jgi:ABC-type nitrate/sulfonate/bicarbonate transport system substrate-binding protein